MLLLLATSMISLFIVKQVLEMRENNILMHLKGRGSIHCICMTIQGTMLSQTNFITPIGSIAPVSGGEAGFIVDCRFGHNSDCRL